LFCIVAFELDDEEEAKSMAADGILGFCDVCGMRDGWYEQWLRMHFWW
jgi:hypothetical protein